MAIDPTDAKQATPWLRDQLLKLGDAFAEGAEVCRAVVAEIDAGLRDPDPGNPVKDVGPEFLQLLDDLKGIVCELESIVMEGDSS